MTAKCIFACVGCTAVGFIAGWGARALVMKKNEELMNNDSDVKSDLDEDKTESTYDICRKRYGGSMFSKEEKDAIEEANAEAESPSEDEEDNSENNNDYADDYSSAPYNPDDDYDDYKIEPRYDQWDTDDDDDEDEEDTKVYKKNIWPYEIDAEEFEEDNDFSKSTLEYFKNNVLIDEDGSEITNPGSIIGSGVLKSLLYSKSVAYVRNESLEIDYEIVYVDENYERYEDDED